MISRIAVPSLNAMMSSCVGSCSALPISKTAGMIIARIASDMIDALTPAICALNFWVPFFNPPSSNDAPSTSRTLPMIEPAMLAFTTVTSPSRSATIVMISSAALPSVAFSRPPIFGPVYTATSSVARPSTAASGTSASAESTNIDVCPPIPITSMPSTTGTRTNSAYRNFIIYLPALSLDLLEGPIAPESRIRHADDIRKLCMPVPLQPARYAINELHQHAGPRECRRPNLDRARPRHEELDRIGHSRDSAHADHGNINRPRDLIHHPQRHRPHRRTRKPARDVRQHRLLALRVDAHPHQRVDQRNRIRAFLLDRLGNLDNIERARTQLHDYRQRRRGPHRPGDICRHRRVPAEAETARADIRARDVHFDRRNSGYVIQLPRHHREILDAFRRDIHNRRDIPGFPHRRIRSNESRDARILQSDGVEHSRRRFSNARHGVPRSRLRRYALADECPQSLHIDKTRKFLAIPETTGGRNHRVPQHELPRVSRCEINLHIWLARLRHPHSMSSISKTGPSTHDVFIPRLVSTMQPRHPPIPPAMVRSTAICTSGRSPSRCL